MGFFKKSTKSKTAPFTSTVQPKVTATTNENPATQDDLKKTPTAATVETSTMKEQLSSKETQPADGTTEQEAPKEGELNTETMIQVLRSKLGLQDMCDGDGAELTSLDDDMSNTSDEEVEEEPEVRQKVHQHEKIVLEDLNGSLAFLTFSRFAVVEETTHLLIKVRVSRTF